MTLPVHAHVYDILAYYADDVREHFEGGQRPFNYLGIGVQEGGCVERVALANPYINLTLCDTWMHEHGGTGRGNHDHVEYKLIEAGHLGERVYLDGPSQRLIPELPDRPTFDLSYVDGDHSYEGAFTDLVETWLRTRGVMIVHDIRFEDVGRAFFRWTDCADGYRSMRYYPRGSGTMVVQR